MTYTPIHAWKRKDKLPSKDPQKIIYGEQLQDEFDAISNEINVLGEQAGEACYSLYGSSVYGIALYSLGYSGGGYDDAQIKADLAAETNARIAGDAGLQTQIDNLPSGGGGASTWDELTGKPTDFPPEAHTQGWDTITDKPTEFPPEAHGHEIAEVNGLQDALDGGSSTHVGPDAPDPAVEGQMWLSTDDGYLYVYYDNSGSPTWMAAERQS